jgi:hypothetical protein
MTIMATNSKVSSAASSTATTAAVSALPSSGGPSLVWVLTLVAALALVGSGVAASVLLRRDPY